MTKKNVGGSKGKQNSIISDIQAVAFMLTVVLAFTFGAVLPFVAHAASFSYTVTIADATFSGHTLTVSAPIDVVKYVGTETSQWVKISWGDGTVEVLQAKLQTNYALSLDGKNFTIHNFVRSHTYATDGSFPVTIKVYHGNESGNEGSAGESNTVTFQTENTLALCSDGIDNDHDGDIDLLDSDCAQFLNHAPVANTDTYNANEDTALSVPVNGVIGNDTDNENDALTATLGTGPSHAASFSFNPNGSFDYTPNTNFSGTDTFTYTVSDGAATSNSATVSIIVSNTEDAPVAVTDSYSTNEDTVLTVNLPGVLGNDTDADNDPITVNLPVESDVDDGTLVMNADGSFTYTPDANFCGIDDFTYKANDGSLLSSTQTVTITVTCVNDAPTANAQNVTTAENAAVSDTLVAADVDGNPLSYATTSSPTHGTLTLNSTTGAFTYTPDTNYVGADSFDFKANDGSVDSNNATVSITVTQTVENTQTLCSDGIDNDFDGKTDLADTDCAAFIPVTPPPPPPSGGGNGGGGGGGGGGNGPIAGSLGGGGNGPIVGSVLGASSSTLPELPAGCNALLHSYMRISKKNDTAEVKKLQKFLNDEQNAGLPINGIFGKMTDAAVRKFQKAHVPQILSPWGITDPTGYVYKTTQRWINLTQCSSLDIPMPVLN